MQEAYSLVRLRNGACSVRSLADDETFHPGIGPAAEAEALYVRQLRLPERARETPGEFVVWDVGLGAAANSLTAIRLIRDSLGDQSARLRLISFDQTSAAASFAIAHAVDLGYVAGFASPLSELLSQNVARFAAGRLSVEWNLEIGDFPARMAQRNHLPESPHAILFDPHSPARNPAMWTTPLFANLFLALNPDRPCALATFTRSTMARAAMLLGGFFVGVGHPSGLKEETTVAANTPSLLDEPLKRDWLDRAKRSHSAEPLPEPVYRQAPLGEETLSRLSHHPQWRPLQKV